MFSIDLHSIVDRTALAIFSHEHIWLHVISHVVMVVMPVTLFFLVLRWIYLALRWTVQRRTKNGRSAGANRAFDLPEGLMGFVLKYSGRSQILLAILALSILPVTYAQLELPKRIINGAISAETLNVGSWTVTQDLEQVDYLLILCAMFLATLIASACLKYFLNIRIGNTSERLLRQIRLSVIRKYRKSENGTNQSTLVPVVTQEVEPICSFSGDAIIVPLLHGGTVVTIITFMMLQNVALGAAAITLLPVQIIIMPKLQRKINASVRLRVGVIRALSGNLQDTSEMRNGNHIRGQIRELHNIRLEIYRTKYLMKSLNNFIMNLTPFFFYTIGGYLVLESHLSLGALVASLASYKDLAPAIREMLGYYQRIHDAKLRYGEIQSFLAPEIDQLKIDPSETQRESYVSH